MLGVRVLTRLRKHTPDPNLGQVYPVPSQVIQTPANPYLYIRTSIQGVEP
jgi:hypothetical protein